jgi:hypothetical protein
MPSGEPDRRTARQELGDSQERLVAALVAGADPPDGFDPDRVRLQADWLAGKRAFQVARACPDLARALGPDYELVFRDYAGLGPKPLLGGVAADGEAFARYLCAAADAVPAEARRAALEFVARD